MIFFVRTTTIFPVFDKSWAFIEAFICCVKIKLRGLFAWLQSSLWASHECIKTDDL